MRITYGSTDASESFLPKKPKASPAEVNKALAKKTDSAMTVSDVLGVIAGYLPTNDLLNFRLCNTLYKGIAEVKTGISMPLFTMFQLFLKQGWATKALNIKYPFGNVSIPQLLLSNGQEIKTINELVCFLSQPENKLFLESLKSPVDTFNQNSNENYTRSRISSRYWLFVAALVLGATGVVLYKLTKLFALTAAAHTTYSLSLGNACCANSDPCMSDQCTKLSCDTVFNNSGAALDWLGSRSDTQSLSWAFNICTQFASKCKSIIGNPQYVDGSGDEGLVMMCDVDKHGKPGLIATSFLATLFTILLSGYFLFETITNFLTYLNEGRFTINDGSPLSREGFQIKVSQFGLFIGKTLNHLPSTETELADGTKIEVVVTK